MTGYFISEDYCRAFKTACQFFPDSLTQIVLNNNGLKDQGLSDIFSGLGHLTGVKKIVIIDNEFGIESLGSFRKMVNKEDSKLEELRLCNCRMQPNVTFDILEDLLAKHLGIRKLSLVKASLNRESVKKLIAFMQASKSLVELDISYNMMSYTDMGEIVTYLHSNKRLQYVNLSWNSIGPGKIFD